MNQGEEFMKNTQNVYVEPKMTGLSKTVKKIEQNRENTVYIKRNFKPATLFELRFARLRKVIQTRSFGDV